MGRRGNTGADSDTDTTVRSVGAAADAKAERHPRAPSDDPFSGAAVGCFTDDGGFAQVLHSLFVGVAADVIVPLRRAQIEFGLFRWSRTGRGATAPRQRQSHEKQTSANAGGSCFHKTQKVSNSSRRSPLPARS